MTAGQLSQRRARTIAAVRGLVVLLCVVGAGAALAAYRSERRLDEIKRLALTSLDYSRAGKSSDPRSEAARRKALQLVPSARLLNPDTQIDAQVALFLEPNKARARTILKEAAHREPENIFLWLALSRLHQAEGHLAGARRSYERARELDPHLQPLR